QGFHHDLAAAQQTVYLQGYGVLGAAHDDHRQWQGLAVQLGLCAAVQHRSQITHQIVFAGVLEARLLVLVIVFQLEGADAHDTFDGIQRNRVEVFADLNHQGAVHRYGEGQAHYKFCTTTPARFDEHGTAEMIDLGVYHVHTHIAPGDLGSLVGGTEA